MPNGEPKPTMPAEEAATEIKVMPEQFYFKKIKAPAEGGKNKKLILVIAILAIVIVLLAGAAYLFTQSLKKGAAKPPTTPVATPTTPPANVPPVNVVPVNAPPVNVPPPAVCGNGNCEEGENSATCPADCPAPPPTPTPATPAVIPLALDTDKDGLTDVEEALYGTNPSNPDTDSDGYPDGLELINLYNPTGFAPQKIEETNLVKIYTNPSYKYTIFYPTSWLVRALDETNNEVIFTSATGEFVEVLVEDNKDNLPLLDWYLTEAPGTSPADVGAVATKSGLLGIKSPDGLTAYFGVDGKIYAISYNIGVKTELNYKSTFEMMIKSFKL